jgi:hypothetical protein
MQISSAVCFCHQSLLLRTDPVTITFRSRTGDSNKESVFACQDPNCHIHYSPDFGYFHYKVGELLGLGDLEKKPQHCHNSETMYMFLMEKDSTLIWACPGCNVTQPFSI